MADIALTLRDYFKGKIDAKTRNELIKAKLAKGGVNLLIGGILTAALIFASNGLLIGGVIGVIVAGAAVSIATNAAMDYVI